MTDYNIQMEEKIYKSNKVSLELLKQLKNAESEIEAQGAFITQLKDQVNNGDKNYIPAKGDYVDQCIADYINTSCNKGQYRSMFKRIEEGVYTFGTKKIFVRVEQGHINIRVGGGYLSIDEFVDQYTPTELDRLER